MNLDNLNIPLLFRIVLYALLFIAMIIIFSYLNTSSSYEIPYDINISNLNYLDNIEISDSEVSIDNINSFDNGVMLFDVNSSVSSINVFRGQEDNIFDFSIQSISSIECKDREFQRGAMDGKSYIYFTCDEYVYYLLKKENEWVVLEGNHGKEYFEMIVTELSNLVSTLSTS